MPSTAARSLVQILRFMPSRWDWSTCCSALRYRLFPLGRAKVTEGAKRPSAPHRQRRLYPRSQTSTWSIRRRSHPAERRFRKGFNRISALGFIASSPWSPARRRQPQSAPTSAPRFPLRWRFARRNCFLHGGGAGHTDAPSGPPGLTARWVSCQLDGTIAGINSAPKYQGRIFPSRTTWTWWSGAEQIAAPGWRTVQRWVDNPHTKPVGLLEKVNRRHYRSDPDVLFLQGVRRRRR